MKVRIRNWGILSHSSRRALSSSWRVCKGSRPQTTRLPRMSETCSMGFMSGEHADYSICIILSFKSKSSSKWARQGRWPEIVTFINMKSFPIVVAKGTTIDLRISSLYHWPVTALHFEWCEGLVHLSVEMSADYNSLTVKSDPSLHEHRIASNGPFPTDGNMLIIRMNRKMGLYRENNIASYISPPVHKLFCPPPCTHRGALLLT